MVFPGGGPNNNVINVGQDELPAPAAKQRINGTLKECGRILKTKWHTLELPLTFLLRGEDAQPPGLRGHFKLRVSFVSIHGQEILSAR